MTLAGYQHTRDHEDQSNQADGAPGQAMVGVLPVVVVSNQGAGVGQPNGGNEARGQVLRCVICIGHADS